MVTEGFRAVKETRKHSEDGDSRLTAIDGRAKQDFLINLVAARYGVHTSHSVCNMCLLELFHEVCMQYAIVLLQEENMVQK